MGLPISKLLGHLPWSKKLLPSEKRSISQINPTHCVKTRPTASTQTSECKKQITLQLPPNSWDSHMHVIGNLDRYPTAKTAVYTPEVHTLNDALSFETSIGVTTIVLVQPSIYGVDNSCLLDALSTLGATRARGVVVVDPNTINQAVLREWHKIGVRGIRVNLQSVGRSLSEEEFVLELQRYADVARPLDWILQLYIPMSTLPLLESAMESLDVRVCLDHFASPNLSPLTEDPYLLRGFSSLIRLLDSGRTWVKISAAYRLAKSDRELDILDAVMKELSCGKRQERLIWASDWPHTRFEGLDIKPFVRRVLGYCAADEVLRDRLFRDNARELWD